MLELGRKEHHLLGGIGVQILIVAVMVFAYTQAVRQLKHRGELRDRLKEQLTVARDQLARHGPRTDVAALQAQVADLKSGLISVPMLRDAARQLEELAKEHGVQDLVVKVGERPAQTLAVPLDGKLDFEAELYAVELSGAMTSRSASALAAVMGDPSSKPLAPLVGMEMARSGSKEDLPVRVSLRWLMAVSPTSTGTALSAPLKAPAKREWGWREEPFSSPFERRSALKIPSAALSRFRLSGILWDEKAPACVINGMALRAGDSVSGYRVALISPKTVLLESDGEEILLRLP